MDARAIIRDLELWPEAPRIEAIPTGYTNENFRVLSAGNLYFARAGEDLPHHGVSRHDEALCARMAAGAGIAPEVVHAQGGVLVTRFVAGTTLRMGETPDPGTLAAVARLLAAVHRLHAPPALGEVDLARVSRGYLERLGTDRLAAGDRRRIEELLSKAPSLSPEGLVHGDAFPENFIDDGRRLWLVDWEYAGRGHPAADLAYAAMNFELSGERLRAFVEAHGGAVELDLVRALIPAAAARDLLWCLVEIEARGLTERLERYARDCCRRLGVEYRPR